MKIAKLFRIEICILSITNNYGEFPSTRTKKWEEAFVEGSQR